MSGQRTAGIDTRHVGCYLGAQEQRELGDDCRYKIPGDGFRFTKNEAKLQKMPKKGPVVTVIVFTPKTQPKQNSFGGVLTI